MQREFAEVLPRCGKCFVDVIVVQSRFHSNVLLTPSLLGAGARIVVRRHRVYSSLGVRSD